MKKAYVLGNVYGRLTVIGDNTGLFSGKDRKVLCRCSCENKTEVMVIINNLKCGHTRSCGCLHKEVVKGNKGSLKHGFKGHPLYTVWLMMKQRCYNENSESYKYYGGRGISVCDEWKNDAGIFCNWCLDNGWEHKLQIDRIDNDGNYEPPNCRMVTCQINNLNQRLLNSMNTSGYCGVTCLKRKNGKLCSWKVFMSFNGKNILNKSGFKSAKEAAIYRDNFIIENDLPHPLNFPNLDTRNKDKK